MATEHLSQSPYRENLKRVQHLPGITREEKLVKKQEINRLRIETYLSWAQFTVYTICFLNQDSLVSRPELIHNLNETDVSLPQPGLGLIFLNNLLSKRQKTAKAIVELDRQANIASVPSNKPVFQRSKRERNKLGETLFFFLTKNPPKDKVDIIPSPLAVTLQTESASDFHRLDKRDNVAGFYRDKTYTAVSPQDDFPLIALNWTQTPFTLPHEQYHAINQAIIDTLSKKGKLTQLWGGTDGSDGFWGSFKQEVTTQKPSRHLLFIRAREYMLPYALNQVKDELLADLVARGDFSHLKNVLIQHGLYDYFDVFRRYFQKSKKPTAEKRLQAQRNFNHVHARLWNEYPIIVKENVQVARKIINMYNIYGLDERKYFFYFVLTQIPIHKWKQQLELTFLQEAEEFDRQMVLLDRTRNKLSQYNRDVRFLAEEILEDAYYQALDYPYNHKTESLDGAIDILRQAVSRVNDMLLFLGEI